MMILNRVMRFVEIFSLRVSIMTLTGIFNNRCVGGIIYILITTNPRKSGDLMLLILLRSSRKGKQALIPTREKLSICSPPHELAFEHYILRLQSKIWFYKRQCSRMTLTVFLPDKLRKINSNEFGDLLFEYNISGELYNYLVDECWKKTCSEKLALVVSSIPRNYTWYQLKDQTEVIHKVLEYSVRLELLPWYKPKLFEEKISKDCE